MQYRTSDWWPWRVPSTLWSGSAPCLTPQSGGGVEGSTRWAPAERSGIRRWSSPSSSPCPSSPCHSRKRSHTCLTPAWDEREGLRETVFKLSSPLTVALDDYTVNYTVQYSGHCRPGPPSWLYGFTLPSSPLIQYFSNYFEQDERSCACPTLRKRGEEDCKDIFEPEGKQVVVRSSIIVLPTAKRQTNRWKLVRVEQLSLDKMTKFKAICFIYCFINGMSGPILCYQMTQLHVAYCLWSFEASSFTRPSVWLMSRISL